MKQPEVTFVVPIYNAEEYIATCIQSVLVQTFSDWELVLINDGSIDSSDDICKKYAAADPRIKYIVQENKGVSIARNKGIGAASGRWITFIDADDLLAPFAVQLAKEIPEEADISISGFTWHTNGFVYQKGGVMLTPNEIAESILCFAQFRKRHNGIRCIDGYNRWSSCGRFYRRELLQKEKVEFCPGIKLGEDLLFCMNACLHAKNIWVNESSVYFYRTNNTSVSRCFRKDRISNTKKLCTELERMVSSNQKYLYYRFVLDRLAACCERYYVHPQSKLSLKGAALELENLCKQDPFYTAIKLCDYRYLSYGKCYRIILMWILFCLKHKVYKFLLKTIKWYGG